MSTSWTQPAVPSRAGLRPEDGLGAAVVACVVVPLVLAPVVGYDVWTVRASVSLVELGAAAAVWRGGTLREAWGALSPVVRAVAAVWLAAMALTTVAAIDPGPAVLRTVEWASHLAFGTAAWAWARRGTGRPERLAGWAAAAALGVSAFAAAAWCAQVWAGHPPDEVTYLPLGNVRHVGFAALLGLGFLLGARSAGRGIGWTAAWVLGWAVLCWTGGRGSIGTALGMVAVWAVGTRADRRTVAVLVGAACAGALGSLALPDDGRTMGLVRFFATVRPDNPAFSANRTLVWEHVFGLWAQRPLLGLGPEGVARPLVTHTHAHNTALQALAEWGAVGAAAFGVLLLVVLARVARAARRTETVAAGGALAVVSAGLANGLLDGLLYGAGTLAFLALAPALAARPVPAPRPAPSRRAWVWAALMLVPAVHLGASAARFAPGTPAPDGLRARIAMAVPLGFRSTEVLWWGKDWAREHPAAAARVAQWGQRHSRTPWAFASLEGDLHAAAGDTAAAEADWRRAAALRHASFDPHRTRSPAPSLGP